MNPWGDPNALQDELLTAQAEVDPRAQMAYHLANLQYRQQLASQPRGGGLLGFLERMIVGQPDAGPVAAALTRYFEEQEDARLASSVEQRLQKAREFQAQRAGHAADEQAKVQAKLNALDQSRDQLTPEQYAAARAHLLGAPAEQGTTINMPSGALTRYGLERAESIEKSAKMARESIPMLKEMLGVLEQSGSGKWQDIKGRAQAWTPFLGTEAAETREKFEVAVKSFINVALEPLRQMGQMSDLEFKSVTAVLPEFGKRPEAVRFALGRLDAIGSRAIADYEGFLQFAQENPEQAQNYGAAHYRLPSASMDMQLPDWAAQGEQEGGLTEEEERELMELRRKYGR